MENTDENRHWDHIIKTCKMPLFKNIFSPTLPPHFKNRWTFFSLQALSKVTRDGFFLMFWIHLTLERILQLLCVGLGFLCSFSRQHIPVCLITANLFHKERRNSILKVSTISQSCFMNVPSLLLVSRTSFSECNWRTFTELHFCSATYIVSLWIWNHSA